MKDINIRAHRLDDLAGDRRLTVEAFAGGTLAKRRDRAGRPARTRLALAQSAYVMNVA
jgi:hypothetical protein